LSVGSVYSIIRYKAIGANILSTLQERIRRNFKKMFHEVRQEVVNQRMNGTTAYWKIGITRSRKRKLTRYILSDFAFLKNHHIEIYIMYEVEKSMYQYFPH
jgi:hypothetical protein